MERRKASTIVLLVLVLGIATVTFMNVDNRHAGPPPPTTTTRSSGSGVSFPGITASREEPTTPYVPPKAAISEPSEPGLPQIRDDSDDDDESWVIKAKKAAGRAIDGQANVQFRYATLTLSDLYGRKEGDPAPPAAGALCELNLIYSGNCRIVQGAETWKECVRRVGAKRLKRILSSRCTQQTVWRELEAADEGSDEGWALLRRGWVYRAQTYSGGGLQPYVPPAQRIIAPFAPPRRCTNGCVQYPISFAAPEANFVSHVSRDKWWGFVPYVPGPVPPKPGLAKYHFGYQDEWLKDQLHQHSFYAYTHKRGGWDCMRHYEILSAGAIPYFADIDVCPNRTVSHLPKELIKQAMAIPGLEHIGRSHHKSEHLETEYVIKKGRYINFKKPGTINFERFDKQRYFELADQILAYSRKYVTAAATAAYVLKTIGYEEPKRVLMIGSGMYDYLHQTIETGLNDLGIQTTVVGSLTDWVYRRKVESPVAEQELEQYRLEKARQSNFTQIAGLAWFFGFRLRPEVMEHPMCSRNDSVMASRIAGGEFDVVIYTYLRSQPVSNIAYWAVVEDAIPKERRIFLRHSDDVGDPDPNSRRACRHGWVFKREMHDVGC